MCNHEQMLDYLYDELPAADRAAFDGHLRGCAACRAEVSQLRSARHALASWSPPEAELGFRIVSNASEPAARQRSRFHPAWGLAAAAVLLVAVAAAIANIEIRYDAAGLVVRTGWATPSTEPAPASAPTAAAGVAASEQLTAALQQLDTRLRQLESAGARTVGAANLGDEGTPAETRSTGISDAELQRTVRAIVAESERRQQRELALRVAQVMRDVDATRAGDLARIEQGLRQIQGLTDAELIRHRDTLNHLLRVTQQR